MSVKVLIALYILLLGSSVMMPAQTNGLNQLDTELFPHGTVYGSDFSPLFKAMEEGEKVLPLFHPIFRSPKIITGKEVGFNEVIVIGTLLMMFFLQLHGEIRKKKMEYYRKKSLDKELWKKARKSVILFYYSLF